MNSEFKSFEEQAKETRMKRLEEELENDEKEIRRLAKKLGYNKRKTKSMPEIFAKEGMEGKSRFRCVLCLGVKYVYYI